MVKKTDSKLIPEINIGTLGHVDHGKSTLVEAISGKWPAVHSEELKRGITIKLGYADATIYKCKKCGLGSTDKCIKCFGDAEPVRTISFVDAPGHETLMATVLAGASLMDGVLFMIAANEKCPCPQTKEHLKVLDVVGIKNIIIIQTKIDIVSKEKALENYKQIQELIKGTVAENAPIIPVSAQKKVNIDILLETIEKIIKTPKRDLTKDPRMYVVRSFDVNKPGTKISKITGGVLGGALVRGKISVGDILQIRPGIEKDGKYKQIDTKVIGLHKANKSLDEATPGGLLGLMTELDPALSKSDSLGGSLVGKNLPNTIDEVSMKIQTFEKVPIQIGDALMINIGTSRTVGIVENNKKVYSMKLKIPICVDKGERAAVSKFMDDRWKLIGYGIIE